jgi:hypothetical protein
VLVANSRNKAELPHASEHLRSNIRTARVVAEMLSEQFFSPVGSREAGFYRYLRNGKSPTECFHYLTGRGILRK